MLHKIIFSVIVFSCIFIQGLSAEEGSDSQKIKIGFILSETGPWAEYGQAQRIALEMARKENPEKFKNISFVYEDCQYLAKNAISAFNKLTRVDKVDLVFVWGVEPSHVVAPLAEAAEFPLIVSAIDSTASRGRNYVVRTINYAEQYAKALVQHFNANNVKRIGIISSQLTFHDLLIDGIKRNLSPDQELEIVANLLPDDNQLQTYVTRLRGKSFDALGLFLNPSQIIQFYRHAETQGVTFPVFGIQTFQSKTLVEATNGKMEGAIFPHNVVSESFTQSFIEQAGHDIQLPWAANAYDFALLAGEVLSALKDKPTSEEVIEIFRSVAPREGSGGPYFSTYEPKVGHYYQYPIAIKVIEGNNFKEVAQYVFRKSESKINS